MKFSDLKFEPHTLSKDSPEGFGDFKDHKQAKWLQNGVGVSIIFGEMFYSNGIDTYEVAVLTGKDKGTPEGYLTEQEVEDLINKVCSDAQPTDK